MIKTDAVIIGAGPTGLFAVHQLGIIGLKAEVIDNLDKIGGQCIELYPDKPIYDIPGIPKCTGESLTKKLVEQIKPFKTKIHLSERVQKIQSQENNWIVETNKGKKFISPNIIIAGGVGSFEPRKFSVKNCEKFENKYLFYSVKNKKIFKNKKIAIFGGGDSALDWALEFSKNSQEVLNKYFFIQVNTGHEQQKSGIDTRRSSEFINYCKKDLKLNVVGLMCLPPINDDPKPHFLMLKQIAIKNSLMNLSMGMSGDYKIALSCGATHIRIGTSFFGSR